ncbi:MAG: TonB-dependent receptor [Acidobacteria bacterium]|nr:TonB-dependent receptor [Acidobacteriota bacterium]
MNRTEKPWITIAAALLMTLPFSTHLSAQGEGLATVRGTIQGQATTPLSDAKVVARNPDTGRSQTAAADETGRFEIAGLAPGLYEFEASHPGFLSQTRRGVPVAAGQSLTLEFVLQPSSATASAASVQRISESQLVGLPLNGRSYSQLATLQAGMADPSGEQASRGIGGGNLTVSGGRSSSNNFLLDGTNIMDTGNRVPRSAAGVQLGADAVYQVQVFSTNYGAEYGRGSGGVLNSITRSGANEFHGTLFEYFRNSKLDATKWEDNASGRQKSPFKRNQFGFTLTGPVRKERTYFMVSYEAMRDRLTTTDLSFFPDQRARDGIITDALGNEVQRIQVNPTVKPYLALYPLPNGASIGGGFGQNGAQIFLPTDENYLTLRVDHKISDRDSLFARYTFDDATSTDSQGTFLFRSRIQSRQQYLTLVGTHIFSLSFLTAFRFGYTRPVDAINTLSSIEIPRSLYFVPGAPQFGQIEIPGMPAFGPLVTTPEANKMNTFQFANDTVVQKGPHALKFGFELHRYRWDVVNGFTQGGSWSFNSLESFLQGGPEGTTLIVALPGSNNQKAFRQTLMGFYAQDNYRMKGNLQLSLGLRYEPATIIKEKHGRLAYLPDPARDTQLQTGQMLKDNPSLVNFSPRLGITWAPGNNRGTVASAGFGIYYDPLLEYVIDLQKNTAPFYKRVVRINFDSSAVFPDAVGAATAVAAATPFQVEGLDYHHIATPRVLRYNLTLQQQAAGGLRFQAAYVGARGNHLFRGYEANLYPLPQKRADGSLYFPPNSGPINPAFGGISIISSDAQSFYNSLQLSAVKSFDRGTSLQANYTYGKSVDDASTSSSGAFAAPSRQYPLMRTLDRSLSDFDLRHRLAVSYFLTLPFGGGHRWLNSPTVSHVLGGWRLGGILSYRSGTPLFPRLNVRTAGFLFVANRPNLLPGHSNNPTKGVTTGCSGVAAGQKLGGPELYFDPCSFSVPEPGTLGNVGRNTLIGPSAFSMDISLQKEFTLGGERRLQFRAEFFNLPNHPNFAGPSAGSSVVFSGAFPGRFNTTAGRLLRTATTSRQIQFALRLTF